MVNEFLWALCGGAYLGARCAKEGIQQSKGRQNPCWWSNKKYNRKRQEELNRMCTWQKDKVSELLGRPVEINTVKDRRMIITELLKREGYDYYDYRAAMNEEAFVKGWKK